MKVTLEIGKLVFTSIYYITMEVHPEIVSLD